MAGDGKLFQEALKRGSDYAWKGLWSKAADEYRLALEQLPGNPQARNYLAMALFRSGYLGESEELYKELWESEPSNLQYLQRLAEVQEALGDVEAAGTSYRLLAEVHVRRGSRKEALSSWKKAVDLNPLDPSLWSGLMDAAAQAGAVSEMMPSYLEFSRQLALRSRFQEAVQVAEKAGALDPANPLVIPLLTSLRRGIEYSWRATSSGRDVPLDELEQLIPPLSGIGQDSAEPQQVKELPTPVKETPRPIETAPVAQPPSIERSVAPERLPERPPMERVVPPPVAVEAPRPVETASETPHRPEAARAVEEQPSAIHAAPPAEEPAPEEIAEASPVQTVVVEETLPHPEAEALVLEKAEETAQPSDAADAAETPEALPEAAVQEGRPAEPKDPLVLARQARRAGKLDEAVGILQRAMDGGTAIADQLQELAELYHQLGRTEEAVGAYEGTLQLNPNSLPSLLGLTRLHLSTRQWGLADESIRRALALPATAKGEQALAVVGLMLELLRSRLDAGEMGSVVEGLCWLHDRVASGRVPALTLDRVERLASELLGNTAGAHLEELYLLPLEERDEICRSLIRTDQELAAGQIRSAADDMYALLAAHPGFLPAQSVLGRVMLAQGRQSEAGERSQRLFDLYNLRGAPQQCLEVMGWSVRGGLVGAESRAELARVLRMRNRLREAEMVESGRWQKPDGVEAGASAVPERSVEELSPWEALLRLAETRFSFGDRDGAVNLVQAALEAGDIVKLDQVTRAALLRVIQLLDTDGDRRQELVAELKVLGRPAELAL